MDLASAKSVAVRERLLIGVIAAVLALLISATAPLRTLENHFADFRISHHGQSSPLSEHIVIVAIDDQTLAQFPYTSPISRNLLASVVQVLDKRKTRAIGFDILFDRRTSEAEDSQFFKVLEGAVTPVAIVSDPGADVRKMICGGDRAVETARSELLPEIQENAETGHGVLCLDAVDEVVRTASFQHAGDEASFAEAILRAAGEGVFPDKDVRLPYALTEQSAWPFPTYSAAQLDLLPAEWFENKIVLIGRITPYSGDWRLTPLRHADVSIPVEPKELMPQGKIPGIVVHAYVIEAALTGAKGPSTNLAVIIFLALVAAAAGVALGVANFPWQSKLLALLGAVAVYWFAIFYLFDWTQILAPFTAPMLALVLATGSALALQERRERAHKQQIHQAFQHYLAPDVVDDLVKRPERLRLRAREREISVLFTDLQGFTNLIDTIPPETVSDTLNGYLDVIVEAVMEAGGAVDKIVGDAVHAIFSAPIDDPDHRLKAAQCTLVIEQRTQAYREEMAKKGVQLGVTRIGVNSGNALVGNFGASRRLDYTAHGSTINIAARLEAANKVFGTLICVSEASKVDAPGLSYREIGPVFVRGVEAPIKLFELTASGAISEKQRLAYVAALEVMSNGADAGEQFQAIVDADPDDGLAAFQLDRIRNGLASEVINA